jgi:hypothetical protein
MALDPEHFERDKLVTPLTTGMVYRDRSEIPGFELDPEVVEALERRRDDTEERFHRRPVDAHTFIAKGAGEAVLHQELQHPTE